MTRLTRSDNLTAALLALFAAVVIITTAAMLDGCTTPQGLPDSGTQPPVPGPVATVSPVSGEIPDQVIKGWPASYDAFIRAQVPESLLKLAALNFCPRYGSMGDDERRGVWATLLHGLAIPESGLDRTDRYKEPGMTDSQGRQVYSEGLLQLSPQDAEHYKTPWCQTISRANNGGKADTDPTRPIFQAANNLGCGLEIMARLISVHPTESQRAALARYWSTMRLGKCEARAYLRTHSNCGAEQGGC